MAIAQHATTLFSKRLNNNKNKMLTPRLTNALYYNTIPVLLEEIDLTIASIANELYYNTIYSLHRNVACGPMSDLLEYRRILLYKSCNADYAPKYSVEQIASRVIQLMKGITTFPIVINTTSTTTTYVPQCDLAGVAFTVSVDCELCGTALDLSVNPTYC